MEVIILATLLGIILGTITMLVSASFITSLVMSALGLIIGCVVFSIWYTSDNEANGFPKATVRDIVMTALVCIGISLIPAIIASTLAISTAVSVAASTVTEKKEVVISEEYEAPHNIEIIQVSDKATTYKELVFTDESGELRHIRLHSGVLNSKCSFADAKKIVIERKGIAYRLNDSKMADKYWQSYVKSEAACGGKMHYKPSPDNYNYYRVYGVNKIIIQ